MKKNIIATVGAVLLLSVLQPAGAQSASCSITCFADFWDYGYTLTPAENQTTEFQISYTQTIFNDAFSTTRSVSWPFAMSIDAIVAFPPDTYGSQEIIMTITTTEDPGTILAQARTDLIHSRAAAVELILDKSGSMGLSNKLQAAKTAASSFIDTIVPLCEVRPGTLQFQHYGVVPYSTTAAFLDTEPFIPDVGDVDYVTPFEDTNARVVTFLQALQAGGTTSIGDGLRVSIGAIDEHVPPGQEAYQRPSFLLLSDGMENTPPWISTELPELISRHIPVYSIGFGEDYQIDSLRMTQLSADTGGVYRHTTDPDDLTKFFLEVMVDNFANTDMILDPKGSISQGQTVSHEFPVSTLDRSVTAVLSWRNPANVLDMALKTPSLTVNSGSSIEGIRTIYRGTAYRIISVPVCQASSGVNCSVPGQWRVEITMPKGSSESYSLTVLSNSDAAFGMAAPRREITLGDVWRIPVALAVGEKILEPTVLRAFVSAPPENVFDRIAKAKVDNAAIAKLVGDDKLPLSAAKGRLVYGDKPLKRKTFELKAPNKNDESGNIMYEFSTDKLLIPGSYTATIQVEWKDGKGYTLHRELTRSIVVKALPIDKSAIKTTLVSQDTAKGTAKIRVTFTPVDVTGHLLGLGLEERMSLILPKGNPIRMRDLGNGSYQAEFEIQKSLGSLRLVMDGREWEVKIQGLK